MGSGLETRFERYGETMIQALGHADRATPARWYLRGLMLPGGRKSVEPMAARVQPRNVRSAHQSMHHLVADADWSDHALLAAVAHEVAPVLTASGQTPCYWIIDDTGHRKYGRHSVGVARQYCGQLGKVDNCQVAVSLSVATEEGSLPLSYQLYLPKDWTEDKARCERAGIPDEIAFATKGTMARTQIEAALAAGIPRGPVLIDAGYGDEAALRDWLSARELVYAVGIRPQTGVWWGEHQPAPVALKQARGRPPHSAGARRNPPPDQRQSAGRSAAASRLSHAHLARRHQRTSQIALCARARACGARRPPAPRGMAAHRVAQGRSRAHPLLSVHPAGGHFVQGAGGHRQDALAHRA